MVLAKFQMIYFFEKLNPYWNGDFLKKYIVWNLILFIE
jgi:hypothetical protein